MALRGFDIVKACRDWQTIHLKSDQLPVDPSCEAGESNPSIGSGSW